MVKKRRLNRELVVTAAARLTNEAGSFSSLTLAGLAAALDVRTPSLYNHIASLEDLQAALALHGLRQLLAAHPESDPGQNGPGSGGSNCPRLPRRSPGLTPVFMN